MSLVRSRQGPQPSARTEGIWPEWRECGAAYPRLAKETWLGAGNHSASPGYGPLSAVQLAIASVAMTADLAGDAALARSWWQGLAPLAPTDLTGLWFGIFTSVSAAPEQRMLYVAGTATFDATDETAEWAADDYVWEPDGRYIVLPGLAATPDQPFDGPLGHAAAVLREVAPWRDLPAVGVAVGYDDGDFLVLHDSG